MNWRAWITFAALGVLWGLPYFFIKLAVAEIAPAGVAWGRVTLAACILLPIAWHRGGLRSLREHRGAVATFAFTEFVGPFFLIALGETWVGSSLSGILIATLPLIVIGVAPMFGLREQLGWRRALGLIVGLLGVVLLLGIDTVHGALQWAGVACILLSTLGYAVGSMTVQKYLTGTDQLGALSASLAIAAIVLLPPAVATAPAHLPSLLALVAVIVLGVVCTAVAMLLYFYLIRQAGAARATVITYINPAVATLLGVGILHEPFGIGMALGMILILAGSWLANSSQQQH